MHLLTSVQTPPAQLQKANWIISGNHLAVPILEGPDCQVPYGGQDPYDESMKLLATIGDDEYIDDGLIGDADIINSSQSHENRPQSLYMTPTPAALAALADTATQELLVAMDSQSTIPTATAFMKFALDDPEMPLQVAEVADNKQEWEICDIVGKEDVDGVPHY